MLTRIDLMTDKLPRAERKVAQWVLSRPHGVLNTATADAAAQAGVSEPTVVRFCRSIGCDGFRDFKVRLAQHLASHHDVVHADVARGDDAGAIVAKVIGRSIRELQGVQERLNAGDVDRAADLLAAAERIAFFGAGASGAVAIDAQNKFFRLGFATSVFVDEPSMRQAAAVVDERSVIVAVSKAGSSTALLQAVRIARGAGAPAIAVTSPASPLSARVDACLLVDVDEDTSAYTPMSSRLAQLAVLDVLQVATALRLGDAAVRRLERSKAALRD